MPMGRNAIKTPTALSTLLRVVAPSTSAFDLKYLQKAEVYLLVLHRTALM